MNKSPTHFSMDNNEGKKVIFKIAHIETLQFAVIEEIPPKTKLKYSVEFRFNANDSRQQLACAFKYHLKSDKSIHAIIEVAITFSIDELEWKSKIRKQKSAVIPQKIARHLAMISVGTTRGVFHEKTYGTSFNRFPIPTINVEKRITEDVVISL
jgi:hypothetical protein